jgi:A/G-specific adenine glycosylase
LRHRPKSEIYLFRQHLLSWFVQDGRHFPWRNKSATTYQKIVAEILLQRTRAATVGNFYHSFMRRFPSWEKLSRAKCEDLGEHLKPIGLWRRKAASLCSLSKEISKMKGRFPKNREDIEALPGVGQYITNAVLLFCHGQAQPLLDVNMARVLERFFGPRTLVDIRYDSYLQNLAAEVVSGIDPISINFAILDLASIICRPKRPRCSACPLSYGCIFLEQDSSISLTKSP